MENLDIKQKMDFILSVGQILAENGASTDKILKNTQRAAIAMKIPKENFNLKVMPTVLFLNINDGEKSNLAFRNYESRGVNVNIIDLLNTFTIKAVKKNYSPQKFQGVLNRIMSRKKIYSHAQIILATGLFCGAFCFLFGGDLLASIYTALCAAVGRFLQIRLVKYGVNHFFAIAAAAFTATFMAYFAILLPTKTVWLPLISCSLFLVPGIPIINGIMDSLGGFLLNGMTKFYNAFLITFSIMVGIVFAAAVCEKIEAIDLSNLILLVDHSAYEFLFAGMIISISFSTFINVPKKILLLLGSFGVLALMVKDFMIFELNLSQGLSAFFSALLIGIMAIKAKSYTQAPMQALTVPAIISFVPGVLIYRFLSSCIYIRYIEVEEFFYEFGFGIDALQIIVAMTVGVTLPHLIANKFFEKNT